jgi:ion channel-forming bestrophin family protein
MVTYNPKDWLKIIFHFHKSDTLRVLFPAIVLIGLITALISFVEQTYFENALPNNLIIFHQISGFIISLVLVFRINSAYDRWWEGRKLWGTLLNSSRNLSIKLNALIPQDEKIKRETIAALIANYAHVLKEHLRSNPNIKLVTELNSTDALNYSKANHKPNFIAKILTNYVLNTCVTHSKTQNDYLILSRNLDDLTDVCGACERIKNTPIPYTYSIFIKKIVFVYILTMSVSFSASTGYWCIPIVMIIFYAFASLELISEEIEDPFGNDENDLPTDEIAERIQQNTQEILAV